MTLIKAMELISDYLDTYEGRDKFLRTLSYTAKLATVLPKSNETVDKLKNVSSQLSHCRVILRLLDDIPVLYSALTFGWSKQEPDWLIKWLEAIEIIVDVVYSPIESICWAGEQNLISINIDKWDKASTWFWIGSLYLSLIKSLRRYKQLSKHQHICIKKICGNIVDSRAVRHEMHNQTLICIRMLLDLSYAISYLPTGTLWGGKLSPWHVGALGTLSSFIGLYQSLSKRASRQTST